MFATKRRKDCPLQRAVWSLLHQWLGMTMVFLVTTTATSDIVTWDEPDLDTWTYPEATQPGSRILGPTFLTDPGLDPETQQFYRSSGHNPARRGMTIVAFDTSVEIEPGLALSRYQINTVTVTCAMQTATGGTVYYDDTPETNAELLADYISGNVDSERPMELYGAAFQASYEGWGFSGSGGDGPPDFEENDCPYNPSGDSGSLSVYPAVVDAGGELVDVSNSMTGGYSATAPDNETDPFDPVPWSIGTVDGLNPGDCIPNDTTFTFSIDLNLQGVTEFMRQSLQDGGLGFVLSSMHYPGDPHEGTILPYPQWYLKEYPTQYGGIPPTLEIDYLILAMPGDFDDNGVVDGDDFQAWQDGFGMTGEAELGDGDADGDGDVDGGDFLIWQRNFVGGQSAGGVQSVPEPSAMVAIFILLGFALAVYRRGLGSTP